MVYYVMSDSGKVIARRTISTFDPSDYDIKRTKVRLKYLDNTIKGSIVDYRNAISENNIQTLDMG